MSVRDDSHALLVGTEVGEADERRHTGSYMRLLLFSAALVAACVLTYQATVSPPMWQPNSAEEGPIEVPHTMFDKKKLSEEFLFGGGDEADTEGGLIGLTETTNSSSPNSNLFSAALDILGNAAYQRNASELPDCNKTCARICPVLEDDLATYRVRSAKEVPSRFGLDIYFYKKYVNVMGIPILSSDLVCDCVLQKAAWIVHGTVSHLKRMPEVLEKMVANKHRVTIMARSEETTDVPEHRNLNPEDYWDERARGLGGTPHHPCSSGAEESVMCEGPKTNSYFGENILLHEFTHGIGRLGFKFLKWDGKDWDDYNGAVFKASMDKGLWKKTYAAKNKVEYFAEAVQTWFDTNMKLPSCSEANHTTDGVHNCVNYRHELKTYDPGLYKHLASLFKADSWRPGQGKSCGCGHPDTIVSGFEALDADGNLKSGGGSADVDSDSSGADTPSPDETSEEEPEIPVPSEKCYELQTQESCADGPGCEWDHGQLKCSHDCTAVESEAACWPTGECAWDGSSKKCHKCIVHADKHDHCDAWAKKGYCETKEEWMKAHCSITCDVLADGQTSCEQWSQTGECARNAAFMLETCQQSCGCKQLMGK